MEDGLGSRRRQLIVRGAALVSVIYAWMMVRYRRLANFRAGITYGPLSTRDEQRQNNLRIIYHSDDTPLCQPAQDAEGTFLPVV